MTEALYARRDGTTYSPTELTRGPWQDDAQHGGPPAALLAGAAESVPGEASMQVARLTVELLRPVPLAPLTVATGELRPGRRVQLVTAELRHEGMPVARATALRIRAGGVALPELPAAPPPPGPDTAGPPRRIPAGGYVREGVEVRFVLGDFSAPGPGVAWIRLRVPVVEGGPPSPLQRVAAAADFGNGISAHLPVRTHLYINPDLTVYLHRLPAGEWVGLDSTTFLDPAGIGLAETALFDREGRIGRSAQALYVADR